jgi:predicted house-cleaning noncanonical NTP pyrophosphatase (MazG superfamily)
MIKLIRDKMGRTIGLGPGDKVRVVENEPEYEKLLIEKLGEEYQELRKEIVKNGVNPDNVLEEAADMIEVLGAIVDHFASCDLELLLDEARRKRQRRGGFLGGIVLETKG